MPSSNLACAPSVLWLASEHQPRRVLDVGVGVGKYGLLTREYLPPLDELAGVEAEARYLDAYPWLTHIYDHLWVDIDVRDLSDENLARFDVVLLIDVLEHLDAEEAATLLKRIPGRVVICTPRDWFQNPEAEEYPSERHRSHWDALAIAKIRPLDAEDVNARERLGAVLVRCAPLP